MNKQTPAQREQGYILLLTLITLVVLLFGVLFVTRGNLLQTVMTGNTLQRQKDVQVGDLALRQVQLAIIQTACNGSPNTCGLLQTVAQGQPWFPVTDAASSMPWTGSTYPTQTFWANCLANQTCDSLAHIKSTVLASVSPPQPFCPERPIFWPSSCQPRCRQTRRRVSSRRRMGRLHRQMATRRITTRFF